MGRLLLSCLATLLVLLSLGGAVLARSCPVEGADRLAQAQRAVVSNAQRADHCHNERHHDSKTGACCACSPCAGAVAPNPFALIVSAFAVKVEPMGPERARTTPSAFPAGLERPPKRTG